MKNIYNFTDYTKILSESIKELNIDVKNIDTDFIDGLVDRLSFTYKKRTKKYIRPIEIKGSMVDSIKIKITFNNKIKMGLEYDDADLKISINSDIVYHMSDIKRDEIYDKLYQLLVKELKSDGYIVNSEII